MKLLTCLFFCLFFSLRLVAGGITGLIVDENKNAIPFASVYVKNTTYGVSANDKGKFFIEIKSNSCILVFSAVGYKNTEKQITFKDNENLDLVIILKEESVVMDEVVISVKQRNLGKEIMKKVRQNRSYYLNKLESYSCRTYQKISIERETKLKSKDSLTINDSIGKKLTEDDIVFVKIQKTKKENIKLVESISEIYFRAPSRYKQEVLAYNDIKSMRSSGNSSVSFGFEYGEHSVITSNYERQDPTLIAFDPQQSDFNFYQNIINAAHLCYKPLQSPLAETAELNYNFKLESSFYEDHKKIYKIEVIPVFKTDALFSGYLYIEDSTFAIRSLDLSINPKSLLKCEKFNIIQNYTSMPDDVQVVSRREFTYVMKTDNGTVMGNTRVNHSDYKVNIDFPKKTFTAEIKSYAVDAFDKDTMFWKQIRPITLKENELNYILSTDSLNRIYQGKEYLDSLDSAYNHLRIWNFLLTGIYHRNREARYDFYINPLILQLNPFGIGGYRHRFGGSANYEFRDAKRLQMEGMIDYGFRNKDVKGWLETGLMYIPKKFVKTSIRVGDYYEMINTYASLGSIFSRSNYARTRTFRISQSMEIINGLYGEIVFDFADQNPITGLQQDKWSKDIFGEINNPTDFKRYTKSEFRLLIEYVIGQKYIIKSGKKIVFGDNYPVVRFMYRKGIPRFINSEVNFDFLEIGIHHEVQVARFGTSGWNVQTGSFVNKRNLRILEYKYFRGSDTLIFSDPTTSFQLLGPTLNTASYYLRANYIHHFDGLIMNKIPLLNLTKITLAAGGGILVVPDRDLNHAEIYGGIERIFKLWHQPFRFGIYAVTADNTIEGANYTFKFGINFYNEYANKWQY